jgi:thioredoxin-related protein
MRPRPAIVLLLVLGCSFSFAQGNKASDVPVSGAALSSYVPVHKFDPNRDAAGDIQAAIAEAQRTGKRILVDIGGDWCQYCHQMDQLFQEHPELLELRDNSFITVAVYYGTDKKNEQVLSHYPKLEGIPHFYVLDGRGSVLHSQHLLELRKGGKYDPDKMKEFLTKWSSSAAGSIGQNDRCTYFCDSSSSMMRAQVSAVRGSNSRRALKGLRRRFAVGQSRNGLSIQKPPADHDAAQS